MRTINKIALSVLAGASMVSCSNFLEIKSPSVVDSDFVFSSYETAKTVMLGAYNSFITNKNQGMLASYDNLGSDTERCSAPSDADIFLGVTYMYGVKDAWSVENADISLSTANINPWGTYYSIISRCNQVIYQIEHKSDWASLSANTPNEWTDLLGQAYALRATCYYDLVRWYGDVIYIDEAGKDIVDLSPRDLILESEIGLLKNVLDNKYMFAVEEQGHMPDQMTRNYAEGLMGRLCFAAAGYQTRRTDLGPDFYVDPDGNAITFDVWGKDEKRQAEYGRRSDWKRFFEMALPYLEDAVNNPAGVKLTTVDPRTDNLGRKYDNPFQYYFNQLTNNYMGEESVYEVAIKKESGNSRIDYNFGRGVMAVNPGFPSRANAQTCSWPEVLYNVFDPADMRRDVSLSTTGSSGTGYEVIYTFNVGNRTDQGIGMNKFDRNRQESPSDYDARQLWSGINFPLMRQADIILMYAEALAVAGKDGEAQAQIRKIHDRAFSADVRDAKFADLLANATPIDGMSKTYAAVIEERKLEFVGEGLRKWDLVRTGLLPKVAYETRNKMVKDLATMKTQGYVSYDNGNEFPAYIWTKLVDAKKDYGYRLTMQTPAGKEDDPVLVPGWRGQNDDWYSYAVAYFGDEATAASKVVKDGPTNLAIKGMFKHIEPGSAEALALEADGYTMQPWGAGQYIKKGTTDTLDPTKEAEWSSYFMCGYTDDDYLAKKAPIYMIYMHRNICLTTGLTNGYGLKSE